MSSALELVRTVAPIAAGAFLNRRSTGTATRRLTTGVDQASGQIRSTGQDLTNLYGNTLRSQQRTLRPYEDVGLKNLHTLDEKVNAEQPQFGYTGADLLKSPGYQFELNQGERAVKAEGNANGTRFSGGTLKALDRYNTDYASTKFQQGFNNALTTYNTNRQASQDQLNNIRDLAGVGERATTADVNAQGNAAAGEAGAITFTGKDLADLMNMRAEAEASGDIQKANGISNAIEQAVKGLNGIDLVNAIRGRTTQPTGVSKEIQGLLDITKKFGGSALAATAPGAVSLPGLAAEIAPAANAELAASLPAGLAATGGGTAAGGAGLAASAAAPAATAAPLTGYAGGGLVTSHGALIGMATNPITIAIAAGIVGVTALLKSQAHWEANTWVKGFQNKFDQNMDQLNRQFQSAAQSGQLSRDQAMQIRSEVAAAMKGYEAKRQEFSSKGKDNRKVASQALNTFNQWYGPNGSKTLGQMDAIISRLSA